jgi:hypothetical protein
MNKMSFTARGFISCFRDYIGVTMSDKHPMEKMEMYKKHIVMITLIGFLILAGLSGAASDTDVKNEPASGRLVQGYRILAIEKSDKDINLVVYRGDYIKFDFSADIEDTILQIPDLSVNQKLGKSLENAPYFKMKSMGRFDFTLGKVTGNIHVIEYKQTHYREVDAREAAELMQNVTPLLLDVRTRGEFSNGHIENALLIPVQELQKRVGELSEYKHSPSL